MREYQKQCYRKNNKKYNDKYYKNISEEKEKMRTEYSKNRYNKFKEAYINSIKNCV